MFRLAVTGFVSVLFAAVGGTQSASVITEAEFLSILDENHPAVVDSAEAVTRAEARLVEARTFDNPDLVGVREDVDGPSRETDLVLSWQLPDPARSKTIASRERELDAARARFDEQILNHRLVLREAYADWALAEARRRQLSAQAQRVESLAERESTRSQRGESSGLEVHRLRLAAIGLRSREALAAADSGRARAQAAAWFPDLPQDAEPVLPELPPAPTFEQPSARLRAAAADLEAAQREREAAGRYVELPEFSLGWKREQFGAQAADGPVVGLSWSLPVFDRKQAARLASDAGIDAATARLEIAQRETRAGRSAAETTYEQLSNAVVRIRGEMGRNETMLDGAEAAFQQGEASLTDLLDTHRSVAEAELALLDLHQAALAAHRDLERLAGSPVLLPSESPSSTD